MRRRLILGPPGTGKTERLLKEVDNFLNSGVKPDRIAFASFTRAAVREARERARIKFNLTDNDLPYFRTLHSLAFHGLGIRRSDILGRDDVQKFAELTGEEISGHRDIGVATLGERGDALLALDQTSRARLVPLLTEYEAQGGYIDRWRLERFVEAYRQFRGDIGKLDFTDLFEMWLGRHDPLVDRGYAGKPLPVDVAIVDEAQDITKLGWKVVDKMFCNVNELVVAADEDQCIYSWSGADPESIITFEGDTEVLSQSYRLPRAVHACATQVTARIQRRREKLFAPRDEDGAVEWLMRPEEADLSQGTWLLLARTRRQLNDLAEIARSQGVSYSLMGNNVVNQPTVRLILAWEGLRTGKPVSGVMINKLIQTKALRERPIQEALDYTKSDLGITADMPIWHEHLESIPYLEREYMISCLRRGEKLNQEPRVRIGTIHYAKGLQADNVMMLTDITERVRKGMELDPDSEERVLYVGITRARHSLFLVTPRTSRSYII
jgi:DNA helicase-2/ATP-dependent DNA helicase PcrA